jgi:predicted RNase H-like HicB family nuclease
MERTSKSMKLLVNVIYDKEYPGYVVDVPQLPGCMSQGKTVEIALKNIRKAIRLYLKETGTKGVASMTEVMTAQIEVSI